MIKQPGRLSKLNIGTIVFPRWFVEGYPVGASVDTRLVIRERKGNRYRTERDDGREGSWWISRDCLRLPGE